MYFDSFNLALLKSVLKCFRKHESVLILSTLKWPFIELMLSASTVILDVKILQVYIQYN